MIAQNNVFTQEKAEKWADSVIRTMSVREKFAQLLMIPVYGNKSKEYIMEIIEKLRKEKPGGIIWMQGGPVRTLKLRNYLNTLIKIPLLHTIDGEWGLSMRLDSTLRFPKAMVLGAVRDDSLIYLTGKYIAAECKRMGIHLNFAPVVDVNNNPMNPVIGLRSFGENKQEVTRRARLYLKGMQDNGVPGCIKHFPGHGDTDTDSHLDLPVITHDRLRLDSLELFPFRELISENLPASVMVGHLFVNSLDSSKKLPATLSERIVKNLLLKEYGFKGLVFTDAMNMKGVSSLFPAGTAEIKAFQAGNDVLLFTENLSLVLDSLENAYRRGQADSVQLHRSCKKILMMKYRLTGAYADTIPTRNLIQDLNKKEVSDFIQKVNNKALTVLKLTSSIPINKKICVVVFSAKTYEKKNTFVRELEKYYLEVRYVSIPYKTSLEKIREILGQKDTGTQYVFLLTDVRFRPDDVFGIGETGKKNLENLIPLYDAMLILNGNPYLLNFLTTQKIPSLLLGYENTVYMQRAMALFLAGVIPCEGRIPVSAGGFKAGDGLQFYPSAQHALVNPFFYADSLINKAIEEKAFPGCQVWVWYKGQKVFHQSYGKVTYDENASAVHSGMIYDLASLTKILSTAYALMALETQKRFQVEGKRLGDYLPELKGTGKDTLPLSMILTHQAGLQAWIPFYLRTLKKKTGEYKPGYYSTKMSKEYPVRVAKNLFTKSSMKDTIFKRITESKMENYGQYLYSDLGYYYLMEIIERITGKTLKEFTDSLFSEAGVNLTYLPYRKYTLKQIVPTENDKVFRKQVIHGFVHDPGAALLGGVCGHAGLFGNAEDVGRMMLIFLNRGVTPEGKRILDSNVVKKYTSYVFPGQCRRGLCFDKPEPNEKKSSPVHSMCSPLSFGHSGFTGTFAWADPENQLIFVFLSNRVHPDASNDKINTMGIRGKLHRFFYEWAAKNPYP
jgi:beta-glucosidase-like glycosyl hydrolase/CubicO group peptidase (beta-lactamase class C family)